MNLAAVILFAAMFVLVPTTVLLLARMRQNDRLIQRIEEVQSRADMQPDIRPVQRTNGLLRPIAAVGGVLARSGLLSTRTLAELQQTLHTSGLRGPAGLSIFVGTKLLLLIGMPTCMFLFMSQSNWWPSYWIALLGGLGVIGLLGPDFMVRRKRKAYLMALDQGLPDALDMLVICSEAGLGLEAAFERVGTEIVQAHPVVSQEMQTTVQEMQINADRRAALIGLGQRTGLENLRRLGGTLVQTMQYGTPLSQALRTLSAEMRQEMLIRFEERAARLPVLLTLPMIVFILPCVFLVVGGPALVQVFQMFYR